MSGVLCKCWFVIVPPASQSERPLGETTDYSKRATGLVWTSVLTSLLHTSSRTWGLCEVLPQSLHIRDIGKPVSCRNSKERIRDGQQESEPWQAGQTRPSGGTQTEAPGQHRPEERSWVRGPPSATSEDKMKAWPSCPASIKPPRPLNAFALIPVPPGRRWVTLW